MSYTEISDKFEEVTQHLKEGGQTLSLLCTFFRGYRKISESFAQQLSKLNETFVAEVSKEASMDTLTNALTVLGHHFSTVASAFAAFSASMQVDIYEPLELFLEHYVNSNVSCTTQGLAIHRQLRKAQAQTHRYKMKYSRALASVEKLEAKGDERSLKQLQVQKDAVSRSFKLYVSAVEDLTDIWDRFDENMPSLMEHLQQSEESRINFVKASLEKFAKNQEQLVKSINTVAADCPVVLANINSQIDVRVFVDINRSNFPKLAREEIISQYTVDTDPNDSIETTPNEIIAGVVDTLVEGLPEAPEVDYSSLSELMHTAAGRVAFLNYLGSKRSHAQLSAEAILHLAAVLKIILTANINETNSDPVIFCKTLSLGRIFYTVEQSKKKYLSSYIASHSIWTYPKQWLEAIEFTIQSRVQANPDPARPPRTSKFNLFSTLKQFATKIPTVFQKDQAYLRAEKTVAYSVTSQFNYFMIHMGLPAQIGSEVVLSISNQVNLDSERTCSLLAELLANQNSVFSEQAHKHSQLERKHRRAQKWGSLLPVVACVPYLELKELAELLLVSKTWYEAMRLKVIRAKLMRENNPEHRSWCWTQLLAQEPEDYATLVQRVQSDPYCIGELSDVIDMDVSRSFRRQKNVPSSALKNVLKSYALLKPSVGYCQGMNYIVGQLYIQLQNEEQTFNCMNGMIEKFEMQELLVTSLPKLKQFFFQLDRLVAMLLPEVHDAFRETGICAGHFSSSWFITIFASTFQGSPDTLARVWDMFMVHGWKAVFKVSIAILQSLADDIVAGSFDDIMFLLSSAGQRNQEVARNALIEAAEAVPVTNYLLKALECEYQHLKERAKLTEM